MIGGHKVMGQCRGVKVRVMIGDHNVGGSRSVVKVRV